MKRKKSKVSVEQFQKDLQELSDKEFAKRYPGINKEAIKDLSDDEIAKVVGGWTPTFVMGAGATAKISFDGTGSDGPTGFNT